MFNALGIARRNYSNVFRSKRLFATSVEELKSFKMPQLHLYLKEKNVVYKKTGLRKPELLELAIKTLENQREEVEKMQLQQKEMEAEKAREKVRAAEDQEFDKLLDNILNSAPASTPTKKVEAPKRTRKTAEVTEKDDLSALIDDIMNNATTKTPPKPSQRYVPPTKEDTWSAGSQVNQEKKDKSKEDDEINKLLDDIFGSSTKSTQSMFEPKKTDTKPKEDFDSLLDSILETSNIRSGSSFNKANQSDLEAMVDDISGLGGTHPSQQHRAIIDVGNRVRLLLRDNANLLKSIKDKCRFVRFYCAGREGYVELQSDNYERLVEVSKSIDEELTVLGHREFWVPDAWNKALFNLFNEEIKKASLSVELFYDYKSSTLNCQGESAEEVEQAKDIVAGMLAKTSSSRWPRSLECVKEDTMKELKS
eukprot:UN26666